MNDSSTYRDMLDELPAFVTVCQKGDDQIRQWWAEKVAQNMGGVGFASSIKLPTPPEDPAVALAGFLAGYTGPAPMDLRSGKKKISEAECAKWFAHGRCLYCGKINHRAAEWAARKKAQTFEVAAAGVQDVGTGTGSKALGKD